MDYIIAGIVSLALCVYLLLRVVEAREVLFRRINYDYQWMVTGRNLLPADPRVCQTAGIVYRNRG